MYSPAKFSENTDEIKSFKNIKSYDCPDRKELIERGKKSK